VALGMFHNLVALGGNSEGWPAVPLTATIRCCCSRKSFPYSAATVGSFKILLDGEEKRQLKNQPKLARSIIRIEINSIRLAKESGRACHRNSTVAPARKTNIGIPIAGLAHGRRFRFVPPLSIASWRTRAEESRNKPTANIAPIAKAIPR